jgi:lambda family phage portal protein
MSLLDTIRGWIKPRRRGIARRSATAFPGAEIGRLVSNWTIEPGAINRWLRFELRTLRARSRQLARGEGYGAKFVRACVNNIAGPAPFILQAKIKQGRKSPGEAAVGLDKDANAAIEAAWREWSKACEITGKLTLAELHRLAVRCLARDGEVFIRILRGREFGPYGLKLQVLDIDRLDEDRNSEGAGAVVKMGVQLDQYGRPVAYHLLRRNPGEYGLWSGSRTPREYEIIPADQVLHLFVPDWPEQVRGVPWMHAAMTRLYHLGGFEEAAVLAARIGASQMAVIERDPENPPATGPEGLGDQTDAAGEPQMNIEAGTMRALPLGWKMSEGWQPKYPDAAVEPFIRSTLRGIAASVGMAYHAFANDPSNVNYSTARVALLEERDMWMSIQSWYCDHFCERVYSEFRSMAILMGKLPKEYAQERFNAIRWQPKRWPWVDPRNETQANVEALGAKLTSRTRIVAEQGEDIEDVFEELAEEEALADQLGIELEAAEPPQPTPPASDPAEEGADGQPTPAKARPRLAAL